MSERFYIVAKNTTEGKHKHNDSETTATFREGMDLLKTLLSMGESGTIYTCEYKSENTSMYDVLYFREYKNILGKLTLMERGNL